LGRPVTGSFCIAGGADAAIVAGGGCCCSTTEPRAAGDCGAAMSSDGRLHTIGAPCAVGDCGMDVNTDVRAVGDCGAVASWRCTTTCGLATGDETRTEASGDETISEQRPVGEAVRASGDVGSATWTCGCSLRRFSTSRGRPPAGSG